MSEDKDGTFARTVEIESRNSVLTLHQLGYGDVCCVVWDAALVLAKYLDVCCRPERFGEDWLRGKKIVELGAGVGCVGIMASCLGADVTMTDLEATVPMLDKNIELNEDQRKLGGGALSARVLDWGDELPVDLAPDIVLLADCVYYSESIDPLLKTLRLLCERKPRGYAIMSQEERTTPGQIPIFQEFMKKLDGEFHIERIPLSEQHETYSSRDIHLMKLTVRTTIVI